MCVFFGLGGFEPPAFRSRTERATNCATARWMLLSRTGYRAPITRSTVCANHTEYRVRQGALVHRPEKKERERRDLNPRPPA